MKVKVHQRRRVVNPDRIELLFVTSDGRFCEVIVALADGQAISYSGDVHPIDLGPALRSQNPLEFGPFWLDQPVWDHFHGSTASYTYEHFKR